MSTTNAERNPTNWRILFLLCLFVMFAHTVSSYLEELLFKSLDFTQASFMNLYMCILYLLFYVVFATIKLDKSTTCRLVLHFQRNQYFDIIFVSMLYVGTNTVSKAALNYVSVPMQMVFKSCKLVAVMLSSGLILGKRYSWQEYTVAGMLVAGMAFFTYGDRQVTNGSSGESEDSSRADQIMLTGIIWLMIALCCDSFLGNLQERVQKSGAVANELELMYLQSIVGIIALLVVTLATGELQSAIALCSDDGRVLTALTAWAVFNQAGIVVLLRVIGEFSAVVRALVRMCVKPLLNSTVCV